MRLCRDYTYFHVGIACGSILDSIILTIHLGFWAIEIPLKEGKL